MKLKYLPFFILFSSTVYGQTAREYFFPAEGKNSSVFQVHDPSENDKLYHSQTIFFKDMKDTALVTTMFYREDIMKGGKEEVVKINDSEILLVGGKANTSPGRVETYTSNGFPIFKMPSANGKSEWTNPKQKGAEQTIYVSEFTKIKVNGKKQKAVKVSVIEKRKRSGKELVFYVDYYVAGIGLYKRTSEDGKEIEVLAEQKYEANLPSVN
ncbi:MAG: hypothetical protein QM734_05890 [Cyclobacteriaceae bacterium]